MSDGFLFEIHREPLAQPAPAAEGQRRKVEGMARARATDPQSSRDAAERVESIGAANVQRQHVIDAVWKWPGRTSLQLAELDKELDRYQFARRLPEVEQMGEVHRREPAGKNKAVTWWPGEAKK